MAPPSSSLQTLAITCNYVGNNCNSPITHHSSRRHQPPTAGGATRSPRLIRSKSGSTPAILLPDTPTPTSVRRRSKSTTKSRSTKAYPENVINPSKITTPSSTQKKLLVPQQDMNNKDGTFVRFLQRSTQRTINVVQKGSSPRLTPTSPSAWALSPARSLPKSAPSTTSGSVGKVLKYFIHKKVAPIQEMEYRKYGLLHNNLLQWRYGNARADAAMASVNIIAEKKLFNVWIRILMMRNYILEKRVHIQRMKHVIKLYQIIYSQDCLLKEWAKMESKNSEAVGRVIRKLSATSVRLPLDDDAKGDLLSVNDAMNTATVVMNSVEATVVKFDYQVERACYLLTELLIIVKQQKEYLEELEKECSHDFIVKGRGEKFKSTSHSNAQGLAKS